MLVLALSALADTTFVVFPLVSFTAASFAEVTLWIVTWLPERCFLLHEDFWTTFVPAWQLYHKVITLLWRRALVYITYAIFAGPAPGTPTRPLVAGPASIRHLLKISAVYVVLRFASRGDCHVWSPPLLRKPCSKCLCYSGSRPPHLHIIMKWN